MEGEIGHGEAITEEETYTYW
jgi:hypothetical protein